MVAKRGRYSGKRIKELEVQIQSVISRHLNQLNKNGTILSTAIEEILEVFTDHGYEYSFWAESEGRTIRKLSHTSSDFVESHRISVNESLSPFYLIVASQKGIKKLPKSIVQHVLQHCNIVITNTIIWKAIQKDRINKLSKELKNSLADVDKTNIDQLATFIKDVLDVKISIIEHIKNPEHVPSNYYLNRIGKKTSKRIVDKELCTLITRDALQGGKVLDVTEYFVKGRGQSRRNRLIVLVPLYQYANSNNVRNQLFLVEANSRILSQDDISIIEELIAYFIDFLQNEQRAYIERFVQDIGYLSSVNDIGAENIDELFLLKTQEVMHKVLELTPAYRCSYWVYDLQYRLLTPKFSLEINDEGEISDFLITTVGVQPKKHRTSAIAYLFNNKDSRNSLMISNVNDFKNDLSGREIDAIIKPNKISQSEASVLIREMDVPYSIMHAESKIIQGFNNDFWFLRTVGNLLTDYKRSLMMRLDGQFVVERLSILNKSHDLSTLLDTMFMSDDPKKEQLERFFRINEFDPDSLKIEEEHFSLSEILDAIFSEMKFYQKKRRQEIFDRISIQKVPKILAFEEVYFGIYYILRTFITNAFRYHDKTRTKMIVSAKLLNETSFDTENARGILSIDCAIMPSLDDDMYELVGRRSISRDGRGRRRGLYLAGLIARQLGGTIDVANTSSGNATRILIQIPLKFSKGLK